MNSFRTGLLLAASALVAPSLAQAQDMVPAPGWYASLGAGLNVLHDADIEGSGFNTEAEFDAGVAGLLAIGYSFGHFRVEGELSARHNGVDRFAGLSGDGDVSAHALMANLIYDFLPGSKWSPYIGAGIGGARLIADDVRAGGAVLLDDDDYALAYQGILGLRYNLNRNWSLNADYRYFATLEPSFRTTAATVPANAGVDGEYRAHSLMVGFTYRFGAPAPAPAPMAQPVQAAPPPAPAPAAPPAAAPAQQVPNVYLVFFDWDKSDLSPVARQVLDRVLEDFRRTGSAKFAVDGFTDTTGPRAYNERLSKLRAETVRGYLLDNGVREDQVQTEWFGEDRLNVPTPDDVAQAENRRVEIRLSR